MTDTTQLPRVTEQRIDDVINTLSYYRLPETTVTICAAELLNGFTVVGKSACIHPEDFNAERGEQYALQDARRQIGELEAYLIMQWMFINENLPEEEEAGRIVSAFDGQPLVSGAQP